MSISSEITRISNAKTAIAESIANKGVSVPSGTKIDGMAALIDSIQTGVAKETWVIKSDASGELVTTHISFTSNGQKFTSIGTNRDLGPITLYYGNTEIAGYEPGTETQYTFNDESYRKLAFDTTPTGDLLTWLQSNAVKQASDTAVQPSKALTVTSNGTTTITPDAPYDAIKQVDLTVNVASGGGGGAGFKVTFPATATRWTNIEEAILILSDGTSVHFEDYSVVAGKTINNVICIMAYSTRYNYFKLTLAIGTIIQLVRSSVISEVYMAKAPGATMTRFGSSYYDSFMPVEDVTISAIEMYNTD